MASIKTEPSSHRMGWDHSRGFGHVTSKEEHERCVIYMSVALPMVKTQVGQIGPAVSSWPVLSRPSTPSSVQNKGVDSRIKAAQDEFGLYSCESRWVIP